MRFTVSLSSTEPVYAQLVRQVREALARGTLRGGEQLPTVRELALELVLNPNTVAAAYREMERAGLVNTQRGRGTFAEFIPAGDGPPAERRKLIHKHVEKLLTEAAHLQLSEEEVLQAVRAAAPKFRLREDRK